MNSEEGKEGGTNLASRPLTPHRQTESMTSPAVSTRLLQTLDIIEDLSPEIVLDFHVGEGGGDVEDLLVGELADFAGWVDVEAGEEAGRGVVADAEEGFEGFLYMDMSLVRGDSVGYIGGGVVWCLP